MTEQIEFTPQYPRVPALMSLDPTKSGIEKMALDIYENVENGSLSPLECAVQIKALEELVKKTRELIQPIVLDEINKHNGKASCRSALLEPMEAGVKYDFTSFTSWSDKKAESDKANLALKQLEDKLKNIPSGMQVIDEETGELLSRPNKTSTTTYKITLAK